MSPQRLRDMRQHAFTAREEARYFRKEARVTRKNHVHLRDERLFEAKRADEVALDIEFELALRGYAPARSISDLESRFGCDPRADAVATMPSHSEFALSGFDVTAKSCVSEAQGQPTPFSLRVGSRGLVSDPVVSAGSDTNHLCRLCGRREIFSPGHLCVRCADEAGEIDDEREGL